MAKKKMKTGKPMAPPTRKAPAGLGKPTEGNTPLVKGGKGKKMGGKGC